MTEADIRQILSKNIKSLRSQRSLSQSELAEKVEERNTLAEYRKDVSAALHKTILAAIDNSLENISSHYD
jgi:transcriptional regulator with XRE-family HTH domain